MCPFLHQYTAASGGYRLLQSVRNAYAMGKVRMVASEFEMATRVVKNRGAAVVELGGFVLWQIAPNMWYVVLAVGGSKVHARFRARSMLAAHPFKRWFDEIPQRGYPYQFREDVTVLKQTRQPNTR